MILTKEQREELYLLLQDGLQAVADGEVDVCFNELCWMLNPKSTIVISDLSTQRVQRTYDIAIRWWKELGKPIGSWGAYAANSKAFNDFEQLLSNISKEKEMESHWEDLITACRQEKEQAAQRQQDINSLQQEVTQLRTERNRVLEQLAATQAALEMERAKNRSQAEAEQPAPQESKDEGVPRWESIVGFCDARKYLAEEQGMKLSTEMFDAVKGTRDYLRTIHNLLITANAWNICMGFAPSWTEMEQPKYGLCLCWNVLERKFEVRPHRICLNDDGRERYNNDTLRSICTVPLVGFESAAIAFRFIYVQRDLINDLITIFEKFK